MLGYYKHYKGGTYMVHQVAKHTETGEIQVIYEDTRGNVWSRPFDMFWSLVKAHGKEVRRFTFEGPSAFESALGEAVERVQRQ